MALKVKVYNQKVEPTGEIELLAKVFGLKVNEALVHQAMVTQRANERQVLAHTKDRSEVRGGGKKPWRQKGTGRARAGSNRSPIWIGGGVTFGPRKDRNFKKDINKKMKRQALFMVLSDKYAHENLVVLEDLKTDEFKTKIMNDLLANIEKKALAGKKQAAKDEKKPKRSILVISDAKDEKVKYSGRNLAGSKFINLDNINIIDLLTYRNLVMTKESVKKISARIK